MITSSKPTETYTLESPGADVIFDYGSVEDYAWTELGSRLEKWYVSLKADSIGYWLLGGPLTRDLHNEFDNNDGNQFASEEDLLNIRATYAIESGTRDKKAKRNYKLDSMTIETTKYQVGYLYETVNKYLVKGVPTVEENTDTFLSLLKNDTGEYSIDAKYNPNGKEVRYKTIYDSEDRVARFFETSAEMFFDLLDSSPRTEGLVSVMKYILYKYTSQDYGVTEFNYDIINREGFEELEGFEDYEDEGFGIV